MFRTKIGLVGAGLVVAVMVFTYLLTVIPIDKEVRARTKAEVVGASTLVQRMHELKARELVDLAQQAAARKDVIDAVLIVDEQKRREATYVALTAFDDRLKSEGRKAHFLGVLDRYGAVIARDLDPNNLYGEKLGFKVVQTALQGTSGTDTEILFSKTNKMMRAAAAPIRSDGTVKGAVIIAYEVTAADARELKALLASTDVAYFMDNTVRATSFSIAGENAEDAEMADAITGAVVGGAKAKEALSQHKSTDVLEVKLQGATYLAVTGPLPLVSSPAAGYVVLSSLTLAEKPVSKVRWMFLGLTIAMLLLVLGGMYLVAKHFVDAEDKVELGVTEIINGNLDYTFDSVEEFEGLANGLNVMLARMLGRPEPGEDGEDPEAGLLRPEVIQLEELDSRPDPMLVQKLASEPEEVYYGRLHGEYVEARRRFSLPVEGITLESLTQKLRANEALLKARHKAQMIRFTVSAQPGKVSLKPIRLG
jgi:hypothetical protein